MSESGQRQFIDPNQVPFLDFLRTGGQQLAQEQMRSIGSVADQLSGRLGGIGAGLLGGLQQIGQGQFGAGVGQAIGGLLGGNPFAQQAAQAAQALPGQSGLEAIAGGQNLLDFQDLLQPGAQLEGQLGALDEAIQRNLASTVGTLGGQASLAGQAGGDRQAFLSSQAAGEAQRAFSSAAGQLLASDLASRRGLAGTAAQLALGQQGNQLAASQALSQGGQFGAGLLADLAGQRQGALQGAGQLGIGQQGNQAQALLGGLDRLGGLMNIGMQPFQAQFAPLMAFGQLLGGPTVLSQGFSRSRGESQSRGSSSSMGFSIGG